MIFSDDDGKSIGSAVKITHVPNHDEMVEAEYKYIGRKFKRHFPIEQELVQKDGRFYDIITIRTLPFLRKHRIWFDITEGFKLLEKEIDKTDVFSGIDAECSCGFKIESEKVLVNGTDCPRCGAHILEARKKGVRG